MVQSHHILEDQSLWINSEQKFKDDTIPLHSRGEKSLDQFWTKVQGWYNPSWFSRTKVTGSVLNKISWMIQSHHILKDRSHQIHFEQEFRDYIIPPHSWGPKSPSHFRRMFKEDTIFLHSWIHKSMDHFRTNVHGWYTPTATSALDISREGLSEQHQACLKNILTLLETKALSIHQQIFHWYSHIGALWIPFCIIFQM